MSEISIRLAKKGDAEAIVAMLSHLVDEIGRGEQFLSTPEAIEQYGLGPNPVFRCFVAGRETPDLGLALFFPIFSTNRAKPGVYVQDLWTSKHVRGQGIGRRLLGEVANYSAAELGADYLSLTVYNNNLKTIEFYHNIGFDVHKNDLPMTLEGAALVQLRSEL